MNLIGFRTDAMLETYRRNDLDVLVSLGGGGAYDIEQVASSIRRRRREGKRVSIVAVAEAAVTMAESGKRAAASPAPTARPGKNGERADPETTAMTWQCGSRAEALAR